MSSTGGNLLDMLAARRRKLRNRSRLATGSLAKLNTWLVELAEAFRDLWESTRQLPAWEQHGALDLGVLTSPSGKCRNIPAVYKAHMVTEMRQYDGLEQKTVQGVVQGLYRSSTPARFRSFLTKRGKDMKAKRAVRRQVRAAKSQLSTSHPEARNFARRMTAWERFNYWTKCKSTAQSEHRYSLAMDATEASFKKTMNATMYFPRKRVALWLPPMDTRVCLLYTSPSPRDPE